MESTRTKIKSFEDLLRTVAGLKTEGKTIVSTNGCYDILHPGHSAGLEWAREQGDILIVGLNSDRSVASIKGSKRPILPQMSRAQNLAAFAAIDYVFVFDDTSPIGWVTQLRPDIHVKGTGSELAPAFAAEKQAVESGGGEMRLAPLMPGISTTDIINTILERYCS